MDEWVVFPDDLKEKYKVELPFRWRDESQTFFASLREGQDGPGLFAVVRRYGSGFNAEFGHEEGFTPFESLDDAMAYVYAKFLFGARDE